MKNKIPTLTTCLLLTGMLISCSESFLEQEPIGVFSESVLYNREALNDLLIGAYSDLNGTPEMSASHAGTMATSPNQPLFGVIHGGECFKGSDAGDQPSWLEIMQFNATSGNMNITHFWVKYYDAIYRCNQVLRIVKEVKDMTEAQKTQVIAEARFLRAHYYFYMKRAFNNIPWIDETVVGDFRIPNYDGSGNYIEIWPNIAADMDFARRNLPATQTDLGRPNKWAADIYYAKILMYRACAGEYPAGFTEALPILTNAIANGVTSKGQKYDLLANYHDNFNCTTENGAESVFACQHSANDGTPTTGMAASPNGDFNAIWFYSNNKNGPGFGRGWGFYQPTCWYADHFRTDAEGLPYLDMYATNPNRLKDDYGLPPAPAAPAPDPFVPDTCGVDPRLDWTIGRRGIPFLDYGTYPGSSWLRNQNHGGPYMVKKWFIWKREDGTFTAAGTRNTAMNTDIIRFSDVLLLAAECEARAGSLDNARALVNRVRKRMADNSSSPTHWVKKADGVTNAANYRIGLYPAGGPKDPFLARESALDAILFERALELGTEGHAFYDIVRFGKGAEKFNAFIAAEKGRFDYLSAAVYSDVPDAYLPIPRDAVDRSKVNGVATLKQNPGY